MRCAEEQIHPSGKRQRAASQKRQTAGRSLTGLLIQSAVWREPTGPGAFLRATGPYARAKRLMPRVIGLNQQAVTLPAGRQDFKQAAFTRG
ncbi:hypothetical protein CKO51_02415 [Rhodopirellula sp. SM50]|nr:hypothetical protein CKO51_02415 [Rhodopirellula sp. SM50]